MFRFFLTFLFILILSSIACCQQNQDNKKHTSKEKIAEIIFLSVDGGRPGFTQLKITRDSVMYYSDVYSDITSTTSLVSKEEKNTRKNWSALIRSLNLSNFDTLKNAKPQSPMDGVDQIITINTQIRVHRLILDNEHSGPIHDFIMRIEAILKKFNTKARIFY